MDSSQPLTGKDSVWSDDSKFMADSVFHGYNQLLKYYFKIYDNDTCVAMVNSKITYLPDFDGFLSIGTIKENKLREAKKFKAAKEKAKNYVLKGFEHLWVAPTAMHIILHLGQCRYLIVRLLVFWAWRPLRGFQVL